MEEKITYTFTISKQEYLSTYMKCGTSMLKKIATVSYCFLFVRKFEMQNIKLGKSFYLSICILHTQYICTIYTVIFLGGLKNCNCFLLCYGGNHKAKTKPQCSISLKKFPHPRDQPTFGIAETNPPNPFGLSLLNCLRTGWLNHGAEPNFKIKA